MAFEKRDMFADSWRPLVPAGMVERGDNDNAAGRPGNNNSPDTPPDSDDGSSPSSSGGTSTAARNSNNGPVRTTLSDRKPPRPQSQ